MANLSPDGKRERTNVGYWFKEAVEFKGANYRSKIYVKPKKNPFERRRGELKMESDKVNINVYEVQIDKNAGKAKWIFLRNKIKCISSLQLWN